jgi:hypothetical protein
MHDQRTVQRLRSTDAFLRADRQQQLGERQSARKLRVIQTDATVASAEQEQYPVSRGKTQVEVLGPC